MVRGIDMTLAELTEEGPWNLPRIGAPPMDNCIATILLTDKRNRSEWLVLDRIANAQGFDAAEFSARFAHLETAWEAATYRQSQQPQNSFETPEGK
jgi:hypothetical protein